MPDIITFLWDVANNWAGYSTGGLLVATLALWYSWRDKVMPRKIALVLAGGFLIIAIYKTWHDQYAENQVGRESGTVAFVGLSGTFNQSSNMANPLLEIKLKSLQSRLIHYQMERLSLVIEGKQSEGDFANHGGYIYAGQEATFRLNEVKDVPLNKEPLSGILEYEITYSMVGSKVVHHSRKKIAFDLFYKSGFGSSRYSNLEEHED
jgi:hypothetical protein